MDQQQIKSFIDAMAESDLSELEFSKDGWTLRLARGAAVRPAVVAPPSPASPPSPVSSLSVSSAPVAAAPAAPTELTAPLYGVVHLRASPGEPLFVTAGRPVRAGQTLCVIEAMKVFNEVRAEHDATLTTVLVTSGQEVDAGQPLFRFA